MLTFHIHLIYEAFLIADILSQSPFSFPAACSLSISVTAILSGHCCKAALANLFSSGLYKKPVSFSSYPVIYYQYFLRHHLEKDIHMQNLSLPNSLFFSSQLMNLTLHRFRWQQPYCFLIMFKSISMSLSIYCEKSQIM